MSGGVRPMLSSTSLAKGELWEKQFKKLQSNPMAPPGLFMEHLRLVSLFSSRVKGWHRKEVGSDVSCLPQLTFTSLQTLLYPIETGSYFSSKMSDNPSLIMLATATVLAWVPLVCKPLWPEVPSPHPASPSSACIPPQAAHYAHPSCARLHPSPTTAGPISKCYLFFIQYGGHLATCVFEQLE